MDAEMYTTMASVEKKHWWYIGRRKIIASFLQNISHSSKTRIIELGSGTGGNLEMLSGFGQTTGLEPNKFGREHAQSLGFDVRNGMLPETPFEPEEADIVVMFDVLEHLENDEACLQAAVRLLKPEGHLFLTVPAYQWMWSDHDIKNHHMRRYTKSQIQYLAKQSGLKIERCTYFNTFLFPVAAIVRIIKNITGSRHDETTLPSPITNKILGGIFSFEEKVIPHIDLPFGLSIAAILKK